MPQKKVHSGLLKNISCPRCTKKISSMTNVLQHMHQPSGSCYHASLANEMDLIHGEDIEVPSAAHSQGDNEDIDMDDFTGYRKPDFDDPHRSQDPDPGIYVKTYKGCMEVFPGGEMFMDQFRCDQYAEQCQENIYFLWASRQEWAFASWLLRSCLSMAAIDCVLSLEIVSCDIPALLKSHYLQQMRNLSLPFTLQKNSGLVWKVFHLAHNGYAKH